MSQEESSARVFGSNVNRAWYQESLPSIDPNSNYYLSKMARSSGHKHAYNGGGDANCIEDGGDSMPGRDYRLNGIVEYTDRGKVVRSERAIDTKLRK